MSSRSQATSEGLYEEKTRTLSLRLQDCGRFLQFHVTEIEVIYGEGRFSRQICPWRVQADQSLLVCESFYLPGKWM